MVGDSEIYQGKKLKSRKSENIGIKKNVKKQITEINIDKRL